MNILHIGKFYPPYRGGMETYLCDLAREQVQQGHQVSVLVHNHDWGRFSSGTAATEEAGVQVVRLRSWRPILFTPLMRGLNRWLKHFINTQPVDLIHLHLPNPSLFVLLLNRSARDIPWVVSWHSDMVTDHSGGLMRLLYRLIRPLETRLLKRVSRILVSTQAYADHSPVLQRHANKTHVLPLGLRTNELEQRDGDETQASAQWAEHSWVAKGFRILHLGRLTFYKNQAMLIAAMADLPDCQLQIVGDGGLRASLELAIERHQVVDRVQLAGAQSWQRIHALYASCELFCLASNDRAESFGVVLLEAMYHNKIILVPDTVGSGMRWLAEQYNKGFVFNNNDPADFVRQVQAIQANHAAIAARPQQFDFAMPAIAQRMAEHYLTIINRRSP
ncbi:glycosyltransferase [Marinicella meishanensis]|uniref:glycosyltransferase n=1 Tax=Marinicella meishanensis TaxID=2873263 RepID=UPI001CBE8A3D|nr:glycosyltransferase [Marinicella sp. NBU2979]